MDGAEAARYRALLGIVGALVQALRDTDALDADRWLLQIGVMRTYFADEGDPDLLAAYDELVRAFAHF